MKYSLIIAVTALAISTSALAAPNDSRSGIPTDTGTSQTVTKLMNEKPTDASQQPTLSTNKLRKPYQLKNRKLDAEKEKQEELQENEATPASGQ